MLIAIDRKTIDCRSGAASRQLLMKKPSRKPVKARRPAIPAPSPRSASQGPAAAAAADAGFTRALTLHREGRVAKAMMSAGCPAMQTMSI